MRSNTRADGTAYAQKFGTAVSTASVEAACQSVQAGSILSGKAVIQ